MAIFENLHFFPAKFVMVTPDAHPVWQEGEEFRMIDTWKLSLFCPITNGWTLFLTCPFFWDWDPRRVLFPNTGNNTSILNCNVGLKVEPDKQKNLVW